MIPYVFVVALYVISRLRNMKIEHVLRVVLVEDGAKRLARSIYSLVRIS